MAEMDGSTMTKHQLQESPTTIAAEKSEMPDIIIDQCQAQVRKAEHHKLLSLAKGR